MNNKLKGLKSWLGRLAGKPSAPLAIADQVTVYVSRNSVTLACGSPQSAQDMFADTAITCQIQVDPLAKLSELGHVLQAQVRSLRAQKRRGARWCNLVLSPQLYALALIERPDVAPDEVKDAVRWQLQEQLDYPAEEACIDVFDLPASASKERPMLFAASMRGEFLHSLVSEVSDAGLAVASVDICELAMRNLAWRSFPDPDQGVALLYLCPGIGLINVSRSDELYLARRISGVPEVFDDNAWNDFSERMALQVQRSIDYYESAMGQPHCNLLLVGCAGGWTSQAVSFLEEMLPIPVKPLPEALHEDLIVEGAAAADVSTEDQVLGLPALGGLLRAPLEASVDDDEPLGEVA